MTLLSPEYTLVRDAPFLSVGAARRWAIDSLKRSGFGEPAIEADELISRMLNRKRTQIYLELHLPFSASSLEFRSWVERRRRHEPVAYIVGKQEFWGIDFSVNRRTLIPRPETERLVDVAARLLRRRHVRQPRILEVGTGSGCVSVALATACPMARIVATDISFDALQVAKSNAVTSGVADRIQFVESDLFFSLEKTYFGYFDLIVSNPPYVSTDERPQLEPELAYEPPLALDGGQDGLAVIYPLVRQSAIYLSAPGFVLLEIGASQADAVEGIFKKAGFQGIRRWLDWSGHERVIGGSFSGSF